MRSLFLIVVILLLGLALVLTVYLVRLQTNLTSSAKYSGSLSLPSSANSYVFASPVRAKAGGDLIRVTVFLLDDEGNPIFDRKIKIESNSQNLVIKDVQVLTDETGKALFDLSSDISGEYYISVFVDEFPVSKNFRLVFD